MDVFASSRAKHPRISKRQERVLKSSLVLLWHRDSLKLHVPQHFSVRFEPSNQTVRFFNPHSREGGQIIAAAQNAHFQKHLRRKPDKAHPAVLPQILIPYLNPSPIGLHLRKHARTPVRDEIAILRHDALYESVSRQVRHLRVRLVRRRQTLKPLLFQRLHHIPRHFRRHIHRSRVTLVRRARVPTSRVLSRLGQRLGSRPSSRFLLPSLTRHSPTIKHEYRPHIRPSKRPRAVYKVLHVFPRPFALAQLSRARVRPSVQPHVPIDAHRLPTVRVADVTRPRHRFQRREEGRYTHGCVVGRGVGRSTRTPPRASDRHCGVGRLSHRCLNSIRQLVLHVFVCFAFLRDTARSTIVGMYGSTARGAGMMANANRGFIS